MAKLYKIEDWQPGMANVYFKCPGCNCDHGVWTEKNDQAHAVWDFNGNMDAPTFSPSILVRWVETPQNLEKDEKGNFIKGADGRVKGAKDMVCHSFITNGMIQFLGDCTHELAGKTVEMIEIDK